jgi:hypothetical protein
MSTRRHKKRYNIKDCAFYNINTKKKLAKILQISESALKDILRDEYLYIRKWKHKKEDRWISEEPKGSDVDIFRPIDIPSPKLKAVQSRIANLLSRIETPPYLFSPVKGRSYVDNARLHIGARAFWMLDIENYFPSCSVNNVAHLFHKRMNCSPDVTAILIKILTLNGSLPQGSPCSPILAFLSNEPMWNEIARIVNDAGCTLSVYADDITISGNHVSGAMIWQVKQCVHRHGMKIKAKKEHCLIYSAAEITGVIVTENKTLIPNRKLLELTNLKEERIRTANKKERAVLDRRIAGRRAQRRQVENH